MKHPLPMMFLLAAALVSCGRGRESNPPSVSVPVELLADSARAIRLQVLPPARASTRIERVSVAPPLAASPVLPEAAPDTAIPSTAASIEPTDDRLKPPILRTPGRLVLPASAMGLLGRGGQAIELDLRIDENGEVAEAVWAGGGSDPELVRAAREWALGMRFYPALQAGRPVAVWCRQRLEVGRR